MERPPYNNLCGQNRVQILLSDSRETPLFSLGKNTHTKKNKEFEHNRFRTVLLRRVVHRRRHSNRTPGLAVKLPSSTQNVKKYCMYVLVWEYLKKKIYRGRTFPALLRISLSTESFPAPYSMASKYLRRRNAERAESRLVRFAHAIPGSTSGSSAS